ncbi:hypothetical protein KGA66_08920 [Actinocrinis puniceicyclus]|uniref:Uncharacterized protein n=1 Tax=Actinocrinis puniceicyclus TaxID=977794 RepID=A0A8J7WPH6_9ACTN|nr:hypothetical protein [Actinocrinis puniceicyclus]MBS2963165.1 hypothetical protein [Actinocrinis puniceicyclus]
MIGWRLFGPRGIPGQAPAELTVRARKGASLDALPRLEPRLWASLCEGLRRQATARLVEVGERLGASQLSPAGSEDLATRDYMLALDAYTAAGKLLDEAATPPDFAGVLVLLDIAAHRFAAANARHQGKRPPHVPRRCFYNPLHGPAAHESDRPRGNGRKRSAVRGAPRTRLPVCAGCLHLLQSKQSPDVLVTPVTVRAGRGRVAGVPVPYYAVPAAQSLWSATGFGCLPGCSDADLVARVLRGESRRAAAPRAAPPR